MNKKWFNNKSKILLLGVVLFLFSMTIVSAQDATTNLLYSIIDQRIQQNQIIKVNTGDWMTDAIIVLAEKQPWIVAVLLLMGTLRVIFKPIMGYLDSTVKKNYSSEDYSKFNNFKSGVIFKIINFILDLIVSIKLPVIAASSPNTDPVVSNKPKIMNSDQDKEFDKTIVPATPTVAIKDK